MTARRLVSHQTILSSPFLRFDSLFTCFLSVSSYVLSHFDCLLRSVCVFARVCVRACVRACVRLCVLDYIITFVSMQCTDNSGCFLRGKRAAIVRGYSAFLSFFLCAAFSSFHTTGCEAYPFTTNALFVSLLNV